MKAMLKCAKEPLFMFAAFVSVIFWISMALYCGAYAVKRGLHDATSDIDQESIDRVSQLIEKYKNDEEIGE